MCEKLRATRQCSSIKDIFAPIHSQALSALYGELEGRGVWPLAGYDQWHDAQETKREQAARAREDAGLARRSTTQMTRCSGAETELSLSSLQPPQYPLLSRSLAQAVQTVGEFVGACENAIALPKSNWHPYLK
jgi:hypothetical protein